MSSYGRQMSHVAVPVSRFFYWIWRSAVVGILGGLLFYGAIRVGIPSRVAGLIKSSGFSSNLGQRAQKQENFSGSKAATLPPGASEPGRTPESAILQKDAPASSGKNESSRKVVAIGPSDANSPKTVTCTFVKTEDSPIRLDRLDGFSAILEAAGAEYISTPIATDEEGMRGVCRWAKVPPGKYKLNLSRLGISQSVTIPAQNGRSVTIEFTFSQGGRLTVRISPVIK